MVTASWGPTEGEENSVQVWKESTGGMKAGPGFSAERGEGQHRASGAGEPRARR